MSPRVFAAGGLDRAVKLQRLPEIMCETRLALRRRIKLRAAGDTRLAFPQPVGAPGMLTVHAELQVGQLPSTLSSVVVVKPAGRVLVLEDDPRQADALVGLLQNEGLEVERQPSASVPPSASACSLDRR